MCQNHPSPSINDRLDTQSQIWGTPYGLWMLCWGICNATHCHSQTRCPYFRVNFTYIYVPDAPSNWWVVDLNLMSNFTVCPLWGLLMVWGCGRYKATQCYPLLMKLIRNMTMICQHNHMALSHLLKSMSLHHCEAQRNRWSLWLKSNPRPPLCALNGNGCVDADAISPIINHSCRILIRPRG